MGRLAIVTPNILDRVTEIEIKKLIKDASYIYTKVYPVIKSIISLVNRHLALGKPGISKKYVTIMNGYLQIIHCDILAYDFVSAIDGMKMLFGAVLDAMIRIKPDCCVVAIGGAMTALEFILGSAHVDE